MDKVTKGVVVGRGEEKREERGREGKERKGKKGKVQRRTESGIRNQLSRRKTHESLRKCFKAEEIVINSVINKCCQEDGSEN